MFAHVATAVISIQEVFHAYLNTFEIAVSHLFLIIFSNNKFTLVNQISTKKISLNFTRLIKTVSEDEKSKFKRSKLLSDTKCSKSFSNDFS